MPITKKEIRKRQRLSIKNRPENLRYHISQRLDDLIELNQEEKRLQHQKNGKPVTGFVSNFDLPTNKYNRNNNHGQSINTNTTNKRSKGNTITVSRRSASDDLFEKIELPALAAFVTLSITSSYGLGYWERRVAFVIVAVIVAMVRRLLRNQKNDTKTHQLNGNDVYGNAIETSSVTINNGVVQSIRQHFFFFRMFVLAVLSGEATHVMPGT